MSRPGRGRILRSPAVAAVAAFVWLLVPALPADAHAVLLRTEPASGAAVDGPAPEQVVLTFSERVRIRPGGIRVFDSSLERVDEGEPRGVDDKTVVVDLQDLRRGSYVVAWRVVSADTHPISGAFGFDVGGPPLPDDKTDEAEPGGGDAGREEADRFDKALEGLGSAPRSVVVSATIARVLGYLSALVLFGALVFLALAWRPATVGGRADRALVDASGRLLRRTWPVAAVASVLLLTTQASVEAGTSLGRGFLPAALGPVLTSTMGRVWIVRMVLLAALLPLLLRLRAGVRAPVPPREAARSVGAMAAGAGGWDAPVDPEPAGTGRGPVRTAMLLAGAFTATPAFWGHATTSDHRALALAADAAHLLSVSAWVGGLLCLLALVPRVLRGASEEERAVVLAHTAPRFSRVALGCVTVLVATGTYLAVVHVTTWKALFGSAYGQVVVAKIVGLALALVLAAFNLLRTQRRLRANAGHPEESAAWARRLRRTVGAEAVITALVVALAAVLVSLAPPRATGTAGAVPQQFTAERVPFGPDTISLSVHPTRAGRPAEAHLQLSLPEGGPDETIDEVTASLTLVDEDLGPFVYEGTRLAPGHFIVQGFTFPARGTWRLELSARQGEFDQFRKTFEFPVG